MKNRPKFNSLGTVKGIVDVFMNRPKKYSVALTLAQELLREESHLSPIEREIIAAYTSKLNKCEYCCGSHTEFAKSIGASEEDIKNILVEENYANHYLEQILLYVRKLTLDPSSISEEDKQNVINSGFTEEQLKDAIAVCAAFNFYNRIVEGHGVEANEETWLPAAFMINTHGYDKRY